MNIYKGLMFLDGFRVLPEDAEDVASPAVPSTSRPAPSPAPRRAAASGWQRRLRAIAAVAGVMPADPRPGCCS